MQEIKMNETLLHLVCYIKDTKKQAISEGLLLSNNQKRYWLSVTRQTYYSLDDKYFKKAGISHNEQNLEAILSYNLPDGIKNTEYSQLGQFSFRGIPYPMRLETPDTDKFHKMLNKHMDRLKRYYAKKEQIENELERLKEQRQKLCYPHWTRFILHPVLIQLKRLTPEIKWEKDIRFTCFGVRGECPVFGETKNNENVGVTFTYNGGKLFYDTGNTINGFPKDLNGLNCITAKIESISQLVGFIHQQYQK